MYTDNLYYSPESLGYELIDVIRLRDEPWEFDLLAVWRNPDGNLVWATDSGCSCPVPFEDHKPEELESFDYSEVETLVRNRVGPEGPLAMEAEGSLARLRKL